MSFVNNPSLNLVLLILLFASPNIAISAPSTVMLAESCTGCHGTDGHSLGRNIPSILGYPVNYFIDTMQAFKTDKRQSTIMGRIAKGYTDQEIRAMAAFFKTRPYVQNRQRLYKNRLKQGRTLYIKHCQRCHGKKGHKWSAGAVGGQWLPYLRYSTNDFIQGRRPGPKAMMKALRKLSASEKESVLQYAASLR